jgi:hypothetical protein
VDVSAVMMWSTIGVLVLGGTYTYVLYIRL